MKITVSEARIVLENRENELSKINRSIQDSMYNVFKRVDGKKELLESPLESMDELLEEKTIIEKDIRQIRLELAKANLTTIIDFELDGEKLSLQEAIYLIKQKRSNLPQTESMGQAKPTSKIVDPNRNNIRTNANAKDYSYEEVKEPTYNTSDCREKVAKEIKLITKLEVAIQAANYSTRVEVRDELL